MIKFLDFLRTLLPNLEIFSSISFAGFGPGWLMGALGTVAISIFGLSIGRTKTVISLISIYVAFVFDRIFPYSEEVGNIIGGALDDYWIRIGIFLLAYIIVFVVFNFSFIRRRLSSNEYSLFGIIILSFLQLGLLVSVVSNMLPEQLVLQWTFGFHNYFSTPVALFFWALAPLPVLLFIKK